MLHNVDHVLKNYERVAVDKNTYLGLQHGVGENLLEYGKPIGYQTENLLDISMDNLLDLIDVRIFRKIFLNCFNFPLV